MKKALITGITGQDGSYLAELLLKKGYDVYGVVRRLSTPHTERLDHIPELGPEVRGKLFYGDLTSGIGNIINEIQPDEIYNLGSMSHVRVSFDVPVYTGDATGLSVIRLLEDIRKGINKGILDKNIKFYQASSSEMFGTEPAPQSFDTKFMPASPYGCAKLFGYHATRVYRNGYGMYASNGILFNHESPRRGINFVTRKITMAAAQIKLGLRDKLYLGNLDAKRDWGHSKDYMNAIHMILQADKPDDWIVATGETYTIREFLQKVFEWHGLNWEDYVEYEKALTRPVEVPALCGDASKIKNELGWKPEYSFEDLVNEMCEEDLKLIKKG